MSNWHGPNPYGVDTICSVHDWQRALLLERIRDLNDIKPWMWKGMFYGSPPLFKKHFDRVTWHFDADDLDKCEAACVVAERAVVVLSRRFRRNRQRMEAAA